ncbi:MFS transporter, partial [Candidatus Enterovibrio escicola]
LQTPFIFVAALSVVNFLILLFLFQDQKADVDSLATMFPNPITNLLDAVKIRDIRTYALLLLLMLMGWNTFFQFIGLYLTVRLGFGQQEVSSFVSWAGFGLALTFLFLVGVAMKMLKPVGMVGLALALMAFCIGGTLLNTHPYVLYLLEVLGAVGFGLSYSGLMAQLSISVDASKQGPIMGMAAAIAAFSAGFSGFAFGFVANINAPIMSALFCVGLAIIICCKKQFGRYI